MFLRTAKRKNKDGSVVEYYQLAHNERHPVTRKPVATIIHNFGRADKVDRAQLVPLCRSIARVCGVTVNDPLSEADANKLPDQIGLPPDLKIKQTVLYGAVLAIETLWERLSFKRTFCDIIKKQKLRAPYKRALLAMIANRLCEPESKLGVWDRWLSKVWLPSCHDIKL